MLCWSESLFETSIIISNCSLLLHVQEISVLDFQICWLLPSLAKKGPEMKGSVHHLLLPLQEHNQMTLCQDHQKTVNQGRKPIYKLLYNIKKKMQATNKMNCYSKNVCWNTEVGRGGGGGSGGIQAGIHSVPPFHSLLPRHVHDKTCTMQSAGSFHLCPALD